MDGKLLVWLLQVLWQLVVHGILVALLMGPMSNLWLHHSIVGLEVFFRLRLVLAVLQDIVLVLDVVDPVCKFHCGVGI